MFTVVCNFDKANKVVQGVNVYVNAKCTQSRVATHKRKQGVKSTQGDDFHDYNTGNIPHVLPVRFLDHNVKKCKHNSFVMKNKK